MPEYSEYIAVFHTRLLDRPFGKIIVDPVKVEISDGPLTFLVPVFLGGSLPAGQQHSLTEQRELRLQSGQTYLVVTIRVREHGDSNPEERGNDGIDRIVAILSALYTPELFSQPLYRGFRTTAQGMQLSGWLKLTHPFAIDAVATTEAIQAVKKRLSLDDDMHRRFGLMAKFLVKAAAYSPGEERFVMLWTILEIFPMQDTTDIAPLSVYLSQVTGHPQAVVKERLGIGRLFGARSDLVHNGILPISIGELGKTVDRLEVICLCVMRHIVGLPYNGALDQYFVDAQNTIHEARPTD